MALTLRFGAVSDIGRIRKKNDDSGYAGPHLVVVADGMGGAPAGDLASTIAIQTIKRLDTQPVDDLLQALAGTIHLANERLAEVIDEDPSIEGMGTTLTSALFDGHQVAIAHLGDSRGYLWRDGRLIRLTRDHSWVQTLIDEGRITEAEAKTHAHRSLLLKVLDGRHDSEPDLSTHDVEDGDRLLICSDGLSGVVADDRIADELATGSPQMAAVRLTTLALDSGSTDNVTVLIGDIVDEADQPAQPAPQAIVVGAAADRHRGPFMRLRTWAQHDEPEPSEILLDPLIDPEELRYAPRPPRGHPWVRRLSVVVVALAVVAGALTVGYRWTQSQYFVGAEGGNVAIYKGVDAELPGIGLNHVYEVQNLRMSALPVFRRSQVINGLAADSLAKARRIVTELRGFARICSHQTTPPPAQTMPPPPTNTPTPTHGTKTAPATTTPGTSTPPTTPTQPVITVGPPTSLTSPGGTTSDNPTECAGSHGGSR